LKLTYIKYFKKIIYTLRKQQPLRCIPIIIVFQIKNIFITAKISQN